MWDLVPREDAISVCGRGGGEGGGLVHTCQEPMGYTSEGGIELNPYLTTPIKRWTTSIKRATFLKYDEKM